MSNYKNNQNKFVAVLNKKIELPRLLNAIGHISTGITSLVSDQDEMKFLDYIDGSDGSHPAISEYPFIVLSAKNGNQIRTLKTAAIQEGIIHNDFVNTMIGSSAENQLMQTKTATDDQLEYWAIVLFDKAEKLDPLTKKFSLFK